MKRSLAVLAAASVAVAGAVWLIPASLHVVDWPEGGPVRVALFAPLRGLALSLAISLTAMTATAIAARRRGDASLERLAGVLSPVLILLLWIVPYLPWLPDRLPLFLVLAGPMRWVILAGALLGVLSATRTGARVLERVAGETDGVNGQQSDQRRGRRRRTVFFVSLLVYVIFGLHWTNTVGLLGDEPHYLVVTQTLLRDHDLDIGRNHEHGDYRSFYPDQLPPDYMNRGLNGVIYSIHAPGLPAILLPGFALAGSNGAVVMLCVIAALAALAIFDLADELAGHRAALLTWLAIAFTVPFIPQGWLIFPEMPAATITAWAALWLWRPVEERPTAWVRRGAVLSLLPWLHTKFVVLLAVLAGFLLLRLRRSITLAAAFAAPIVFATIAWLFSFYEMYGTFNPQAPYGGYPSRYVLWVNVPRSLLGLIADQKLGLLLYSPVYLLAIVGCWRLVRRPSLRTYGVQLLVAIGVFVLSSARLYMWWGGASAPARFLVPILPLLTPMIALSVGAAGRGPVRALLALTLPLSLAIAIGASAIPAGGWLFNPAHGTARLLDVFQGPAPLSMVLPTFTNPDWTTPLLQLIFWLAAAAAGCIAAAACVRFASSGTFWSATTGVVVFGALAAVLHPRVGAEARRYTATRGRTSLLSAYDGDRLRGYDYGSKKRLYGDAIVRRAPIVFARDSAIDPAAAQVAGPFELPPARYEARVWFSSSRTSADAVISSGRYEIARAPVAERNPTVMPFRTPIMLPLWVGASNDTAARSLVHGEIVPVEVVPRSARVTVRALGVEPIAGHAGAFIFYTDESTYPEGGVFWTRGTERGSVFVVPAGSATLVLILHVGPIDNAVRIGVGKREITEQLSANETRRIEFPLAPAETRIPVSVQTQTAFQPSKSDPTSTDTRLLGCQVRIQLH